MPGMSNYKRLKWIESPDGRFALEVLEHLRGNAQFVVYRRSPTIVAAHTSPWIAIQNSGLYPDADCAERDGLAQWAVQPQSRFSGMTTNERLFAAELLGTFDRAAKCRDREGMVAILEKVELGDQAAQIADAVLASPTTYGY